MWAMNTHHLSCINTDMVGLNYLFSLIPTVFKYTAQSPIYMAWHEANIDTLRHTRQVSKSNIHNCKARGERTLLCNHHHLICCAELRGKLLPSTARCIVHSCDSGNHASSYAAAQQGDPEAHLVVEEEVQRQGGVQASGFLSDDDVRCNPRRQIDDGWMVRWSSILLHALHLDSIISPALPVMVRLPPTVATKEMIAQASRLDSSSKYTTLGLASWITGTLPRNCEVMRMKAEIPTMELKLLKGLVPAIESLKYSDEMRRIII